MLYKVHVSCVQGILSYYVLPCLLMDYIMDPHTLFPVRSGLDSENQWKSALHIACAASAFLPHWWGIR